MHLFLPGAGLFRADLHTAPFIRQALHLRCFQATQFQQIVLKMDCMWKPESFLDKESIHLRYCGDIVHVLALLSLNFESKFSSLDHGSGIIPTGIRNQVGIVPRCHPPRQWDRRNLIQNPYPLLHRFYRTIFQCLVLPGAQDDFGRNANDLPCHTP